jgi:hypothetical protein
MLRRLGSKRRLPLLQQKEGNDSPHPRPRWQWVGFGAVSMIVVWVPLAYAAEELVVHLGTHLLEPLGTVPEASTGALGLAVFVGPPASLVLAASAGGYLMGRWSEAKRGIDAVSAAALAVLFGIGLTWAKSGVMGLALVALLLAAPAAALGASLGRGGRARGARFD